MLTEAGRDYIAEALVGDATPIFDDANSFIGVGDSANEFAVGQTDLESVTNKLRKGMEAGFPSRTGNVITFKAMFSPLEANWTWNEWGVFNDDTAGVMLNRLVEYIGIKESGQTWYITVELTILIGS